MAFFASASPVSTARALSARKVDNAGGNSGFPPVGTLEGLRERLLELSRSSSDVDLVLLLLLGFFLVLLEELACFLLSLRLPPLLGFFSRFTDDDLSSDLVLDLLTAGMLCCLSLAVLGAGIAAAPEEVFTKVSAAVTSSSDGGPGGTVYTCDSWLNHCWYL